MLDQFLKIAIVNLTLMIPNGRHNVMNVRKGIYFASSAFVALFLGLASPLLTVDGGTAYAAEGSGSGSGSGSGGPGGGSGGGGGGGSGPGGGGGGSGGGGGGPGGGSGSGSGSGGPF